MSSSESDHNRVDRDATPKAKVLRATSTPKGVQPPSYARRSTRESRKPAWLEAQPTNLRAKRPGKKASDRQDTPPVDVFGPEIPTQSLQQRLSIVLQSVWRSVQSCGLFTFLLAAQVPAIPIQIPSTTTSRVSTNTRGLTKSDLKLEASPDCHLRKVVPFAPMLDQLLQDVQSLLAKPSFDPNAQWLNKVEPSITASHLPGQIFTEHDTEDYIWGIIIRPVLAILHYCLYGDKHHKFPNASSLGGSTAIPDGVLFGKSLQDLLATLEFKNPAVLDKIDGDFTKLLQTWPMMNIGRAAKFNWPRRIEGLNKTTKVLCQVWSQMIDKGVSYGVLSSYKHTYFLVRAAENPDTLYVSRRYGHDEDILLVTFAFIALATGNLPTKRLLLPKVDTGHWKGLGYDEENDSTMPGLVQSTMAPFVPGKNDVVIEREEEFKWVDRDSTSG